jgi:hypothetical protein
VWTAVEAELADRAANWTTVAAIVALKEDKDSLHAALRTRERLDRLGCAGTPVLVRLRQRRELGQFAASLDGVQSLLGRLTPFGDLGELTGLDMLDDSRQDSLARAVHDTYRVGNARSEADRPWSELPERFKQSNRASADHIPVKLGSVGLRLVEGRSASAEPTPAEIEAMSAVEHHRWVIERQTMGWTRTPRGTKPDAVARLHPDLVAWEELDEDDREKDRVVVRTIARSSAAAGLSIRRERLIDAASHGLAAAEAALAAVTADELAVVIFDPHDTASFEFAEDAARRGAKLWVRWREGSHNRLVAPATPSATLLAAIELAVSEREAAAILGLALPKSSTRRRAPAKRPAQTA